MTSSAAGGFPTTPAGVSPRDRMTLASSAIYAGISTARPVICPAGRFRSVAVVHNLVGAKRLGLLQFPVIHVGGHDADGCEHAQELNGHVSEPPNTEDNNGALSIEVRQRPLYRVVRCQRGITQRSCLRWTQVTKRNQQSRGGHQHVFGHPTIQTQSAAKAVH